LHEFKNELDKIINDIYKKSISLEHFWRCLIFYFGKETEYLRFLRSIREAINFKKYRWVAEKWKLLRID